jgi:hypothetical protein
VLSDDLVRVAADRGEGAAHRRADRRRLGTAVKPLPERIFGIVPSKRRWFVSWPGQKRLPVSGLYDIGPQLVPPIPDGWISTGSSRNVSKMQPAFS